VFLPYLADSLEPIAVCTMNKKQSSVARFFQHLHLAMLDIAILVSLFFVLLGAVCLGVSVLGGPTDPVGGSLLGLLLVALFSYAGHHSFRERQKCAKAYAGDRQAAQELEWEYWRNRCQVGVVNGPLVAFLGVMLLVGSMKDEQHGAVTLAGLAASLLCLAVGTLVFFRSLKGLKRHR
jgi:hypothetical protein